jgi:hypothetical protein
MRVARPLALPCSVRGWLGRGPEVDTGVQPGEAACRPSDHRAAVPPFVTAEASASTVSLQKTGCKPVDEDRKRQFRSISGTGNGDSARPVVGEKLRIELDNVRAPPA